MEQLEDRSAEELSRITDKVFLTPTGKRIAKEQIRKIEGFMRKYGSLTGMWRDDSGAGWEAGRLAQCRRG